MTITVYANHQDWEVISEKEYLELVESDFKDAIDCDRYDLDYFLGDEKGYSYEYIFNLTPSEKEEVLNEFHAYVREQVKKDLEEDWREHEIEI